MNDLTFEQFVLKANEAKAPEQMSGCLLDFVLKNTNGSKTQIDFFVGALKENIQNSAILADLVILAKRKWNSRGSMRLVRYMFVADSDLKWLSKYECRQAARFGRLELLTFLHETCHLEIGERALTLAIAGDHLECMQYIIDNTDIELTDRYSIEAAWHGAIKCLTFMHENDIQISDTACTAAAKNNQLVCLRFLMEATDATFNGKFLISVINRNNVDILGYLCLHMSSELLKAASFSAAKMGRYDCLCVLHENGVVLGPDHVRPAVKSMSLKCLAYVFEVCEKNITVEDDWLLSAIEIDAVECFIFLVGKTDSINIRDWIYLAISYDASDCLQILMNHEDPTKQDCNLAIELGHHRCLSAIYRECPKMVDIEQTFSALMYGRPRCFFVSLFN